MFAGVELAISVFIGEVADRQGTEVIEDPAVGNAINVRIIFAGIPIQSLVNLPQVSDRYAFYDVGDGAPTMARRSVFKKDPRDAVHILSHPQRSSPGYSGEIPCPGEVRPA